MRRIIQFTAVVIAGLALGYAIMAAGTPKMVTVNPEIQAAEPLFYTVAPREAAERAGEWDDCQLFATMSRPCLWRAL